MDRKNTNVMKIADDIIAKSYQLEGCYSKVRNIISRDHAEFFTRTSDELRELGKSIKTEIGQYKKEVTDNMNKSRIELASAKKEIFSLKRKVEDLETDQEFSQMDDSYLSSQEDLLRQTEEMPKKRTKTASMLENCTFSYTRAREIM